LSHQSLKYIAFIFLLWVACILLINPIGNFPLNDDWSYAKSVKTLYDNGKLVLYNWGEMTLIAHIYWAYLFVQIFGFSFTVLRWSTLIFSLAGVLGVYAICRQLKFTEKHSLLASVLLLVNPIYLALSFSYMTDVPFCSLCIWAIYFFIRARHKYSIKDLLLATFFCVWALMIRQLAFVIPIAWLIAILGTRSINKRNMLFSLTPLILLLICYFSYGYLMKSNGLLQERYNDKLGLLTNTLLSFNPKLLINIPGYFFVILAYLGLFLGPLHWFKFRELISSKKSKIIASIYVIGISGILIATGKFIPSLDNVFIDFGIGPTTLYDHYGNFTQSPNPQLPKVFWWLITFLGVLGSSVWIIEVFQLKARLHERKFSFLSVFILACIFIYVAPFVVVGIYDRYLIFLMPLFAILLLKNTPTETRIKPIVYAFVLVISCFSVAAIHDYLSWNRLRWQTLNELAESGVPLYKIQGGAEFTAWHHYSDYDEKWWENVQNDFVLVFNPDKGDKILKEVNYNRWLPGEGKMFLVKRQL